MENDYGKKPIWFWIVIYATIALVAYGAIYFVFFAGKGGTSSNPYSQVTPTPTPIMSSQTNTTTVTPVVASNSVTISNFNFSPSPLTIKVGDKVTWDNQDSVGHTATSDNNSFDTGTISPGQSGSFTFTKAGTYAYHCSVHPSMKGTIIVQ